MQLSEDKVYRTRDGKCRDVRVERNGRNGRYPWSTIDAVAGAKRIYTDTGAYDVNEQTHSLDLFAQEPEPEPAAPFRYADCPPWSDGRRRAWTRGTEGDKPQLRVLLCDNAPGNKPIVVCTEHDSYLVISTRFANGRNDEHRDGRTDLVRPAYEPKTPREFWVNEYPEGLGFHYTLDRANNCARPDRIGPARRFEIPQE